MSKENGIRNGCQDVFHAFLVKNAHYDGKLEIPVLQPETEIPNKLISFTKALRTEDYDQWIHFYEDDVSFERIWNKPHQYLPLLKRFRGVISPDFSVYRDMPLVMQQWNTYRGKALGHWWQEEGLHVLPNVRTGDQRTYDFCCAGVPKGGVVAVGSHGCMKVKKDREYFQQGLEEIVNRLSPEVVVVYGTTPKEIFACCDDRGIRVLQFDSEFAVSRKTRKAASA